MQGGGAGANVFLVGGGRRSRSIPLLPAWPMCSEMTSRMVGLCVCVCEGVRGEGKGLPTNDGEGSREESKAECDRETNETKKKNTKTLSSH